jgi:predicted component of type VI protein secretion system
MANEYVQEVLKYVKSTYEAMTDNAVKMQEQGEKALQEMLAKSKDVQAEGEKAINEFLANVKKGRDEFKKMMDDAVAKFESTFSKK